MIGKLSDIKYMEVVDLTKEGKCISCGNCCSSLLYLSKNEYKAIERYVRKKKIKPHHHDKAPLANRDGVIDLICPFRDSISRKCTIYDKRPEICRRFVCNKSIEEIERNKIEIAQGRHIFNMWDFFGGKNDI